MLLLCYPILFSMPLLPPRITEVRPLEASNEFDEEDTTPGDDVNEPPRLAPMRTSSAGIAP